NSAPGFRPKQQASGFQRIEDNPPGTRLIEPDVAHQPGAARTKETGEQSRIRRPGDSGIDLADPHFKPAAPPDNVKIRARGAARARLSQPARHDLALTQ